MPETLQRLGDYHDEVLAHLEEHEIFYYIDVHRTYFRVVLSAITEDDFRTARRIIGTMEKSKSHYGLKLERNLYEGMDSIVLYPPDGFCEKVQVGTQTVTKPDPDAEVPTIEVEEPVYEWQCPEIVLG